MTTTTSSAEFAALAAKIGNKAAKIEMARRQAEQTKPEVRWAEAAKSWRIGMGMSHADVVRQLQNPTLGFGLNREAALAIAEVVDKEIAAEAAASTIRRNDEAPHEAEFRAAWKAAARMVTVYDEDGGTSQDLRVPADWTYEGCRTIGAFLKKRGF